jgi:cytosine/adenosine deaminase-related metal-dependent hydrolase
MDRQPTWTLTARWVFPGAGPPLPGGTVTVAGERLVAVEPAGRRTADVNLGDCAVLPGLVNSHTHLDLSGLRGQLRPSASFPDWLRAVIRHRRGLSSERLAADISSGLNESLRYGTTLLGDISGQGLSWPILSRAPARAVVFFELLGLPRSRIRRAWVDAVAWLQGHPATATCRPGLSPHAPYSVHVLLYALASRLANRQALPLATHLAETLAELELLAHRRGPFVEFLTELGVWDPEGLAVGPEQILRLQKRVASSLLVHGNYLAPTASLPSGSMVVYCPRTHAAFHNKAHPFREFLARGIRVALGTDSLASNPDLDVLAEARFLHQCYPEVSGAALLRMATLSGAEALGWQEETGSLVPGKSADLVVLPVGAADPPDPYRLVWEGAEPVRAVMCRGKWLEDAEREERNDSCGAAP